MLVADRGRDAAVSEIKMAAKVEDAAERMVRGIPDMEIFLGCIAYVPSVRISRHGQDWEAAMP